MSFMKDKYLSKEGLVREVKRKQLIDLYFGRKPDSDNNELVMVDSNEKYHCKDCEATVEYNGFVSVRVQSNLQELINLCEKLTKSV